MYIRPVIYYVVGCVIIPRPAPQARNFDGWAFRSVIQIASIMILGALY
jgi:hypothetical protein